MLTHKKFAVSLALAAALALGPGPLKVRFVSRRALSFYQRREKS